MRQLVAELTTRNVSYVAASYAVVGFVPIQAYRGRDSKHVPGLEATKHRALELGVSPSDSATR